MSPYRLLNSQKSSNEVDSVPVPANNIKNQILKFGSSTTKATAAALSTMIIAGSQLPAFGKENLIWEKVELPIRETLFDISFDPSKPLHGWIVGSKGTFLETFDGGNTWIPRSFSNLDEDEEITYRFEVASLNQDEGWIVGTCFIE